MEKQEKLFILVKEKKKKKSGDMPEQTVQDYADCSIPTDLLWQEKQSQMMKQFDQDVLPTVCSGLIGMYYQQCVSQQLNRISTTKCPTFALKCANFGEVGEKNFLANTNLTPQIQLTTKAAWETKILLIFEASQHQIRHFFQPKSRYFDYPLKTCSGCSLEVPHWGASNEQPEHVFKEK